MKDSLSTRNAEDQPPSNTLGNVKTSRKRKRTAPLDSESAETTELLEPRNDKKRDEHRLSYPDPSTDESLTEQSRRALSYAYERCRRVEDWKFNKARQNWLLRNVWSEQAVPETYTPLVVEYLVGIRGGAREKLIAECDSKLPTSGDALMQQLLSDSTKGASMISNQQQRSRSILSALQENS